MNEFIERIKSKKRILIGMTVALILFTIPVVLIVDDFVHDILLVPFAYYLWLGNIIVDALPQIIFIGILIAVSIIIALPSIFKGRHTIWPAQPANNDVEGQVALWENRLRLLTLGSYTRNRLAYHIGHLVVQILAYEERLPIRAVIYGIETSRFEMPEDVRLFILDGIGSNNSRQTRPFVQRIQLWLRRNLTPALHRQTYKPYAEIASVTQYIEKKLQIVETQHRTQSTTVEST